MDLMNHKIDNSSFIKLSLAVLIITCITILVLLRTKGYITQEYIISLIQSKKTIAPYVMATLYIISPALILPTFYLTLLSGAFFGPFWGVVFDVCGATLGSTIAFIISRYIAGDYVRTKIRNNRFHQLLSYGGNRGWKLNAFLRLNPIFPSALIGYFFGLTKIRLLEFSISTLVFLLPPCIVVVLLASSISSYIFNNNIKGLMTRVLILVLCLIVWFVLKRFSKWYKRAVLPNNNK